MMLWLDHKWENAHVIFKALMNNIVPLLLNKGTSLFITSYYVQGTKLVAGIFASLTSQKYNGNLLSGR